MSFAAAPTPPRFEHRTDSGQILGLGAADPRLSRVDAKITVPVGCSATVEPPDGSPAVRVGHDEREWSVAADAIVATAAGAVAQRV
jgi:hypothetical protein